MQNFSKLKPHKNICSQNWWLTTVPDELRPNQEFHCTAVFKRVCTLTKVNQSGSVVEIISLTSRTGSLILNRKICVRKAVKLG